MVYMATSADLNTVRFSSWSVSWKTMTHPALGGRANVASNEELSFGSSEADQSDDAQEGGASSTELTEK